MISNLTAKLAAFESFLQDFFQENHAIGLSIGIVLAGETVFAKGFGSAQLGVKPLPMTPDTMMSIQSVTKNFTAVSILQLAEQGRVDLDAPVVQYLPYFRTEEKSVSDTITVRQMLSHTAGFSSEIGIGNLISPHARAYYDQEEEWLEDLAASGLTEELVASIRTREEVTRFLANVPLQSAPGAEWRYCTDAYVVVGDLFDKVSDQGWEAHVQTEIFDRLRLTRTTTAPQRVQTEADHALYYEVAPDRVQQVPFPVNPVSAPIGFIYSTVHDLLKYLAWQMRPETDAILTPKSVTEMHKPVARVAESWKFGEETPFYGLGCTTETYKGVRLIEHGGGFPGVRARISMVPDWQLGIVALLNFNTQNTHQIARMAIDLLLAQ